LSKLKESQLLVVEGTLYPILTRLKNDGCLNYRWEESSSGPPRKYYSITPEGELFLTELKQGWQGLIESVNRLLTDQHLSNSSIVKPFES
jgi:PadR family transcriptional regulator PadR